MKTGDPMAGVPISKTKLGDRNSNWRNGEMHSRGRVYVYSPSHPKASHHGYVARYRLVMEASIGRPLTDDEIVHHKNGDVSDDSLSNLELMSQSEHCRQHFAKTPVELVGLVKSLRSSMSPPMKPKAIQAVTGLPMRRIYSIVYNETWKGI